MRKRNNQILIRLDDNELKILRNKIKKSNLSQSEFIRKNLLYKQIIVFENTQGFLIELKRIGNNLNQLTRAVHQGKINCENELQNLTNEVKKIWQSLKLLKGDKI